MISDGKLFRSSVESYSIRMAVGAQHRVSPIEVLQAHSDYLHNWSVKTPNFREERSLMSILQVQRQILWRR